jgi:pimeloyl-ACP methyl ester carboxylesterase
MGHNAMLGVDRTVKLNVNGSVQQMRICGARTGLPPLLIVQGGPGLPLLHEVPKFQRLLNLERDFLVGYWEQRGCGSAPRHEAMGVSWPQQIDDLRTVLAWFHGEMKQPVTFGALLREMLVGMIRAYGVGGAARALRNVNLMQSRLLPQIVSLDLFADPPRVTVPVHYVFGERDAVTAASAPDRLPAAIAAPASTVVRVPDAGHMVHFDRPDVVRSIAERI